MSSITKCAPKPLSIVDLLELFVVACYVVLPAGQSIDKATLAKISAKSDLKEKIDVTLMLRRQHEAELLLLLKKLATGEDIPPLDRAIFTSRFGAGREDISKVDTFASF
jgi:kumamolisin